MIVTIWRKGQGNLPTFHDNACHPANFAAARHTSAYTKTNTLVICSDENEQIDIVDTCMVQQHPKWCQPSCKSPSCKL